MFLLIKFFYNFYYITGALKNWVLDLLIISCIFVDFHSIRHFDGSN